MCTCVGARKNLCAGEFAEAAFDPILKMEAEPKAASDTQRARQSIRRIQRIMLLY
jgi:hypothetical protein